MKEILKIVLSLLFWIRNLKLDPTYDINSMIKKNEYDVNKILCCKKSMYVHAYFSDIFISGKNVVFSDFRYFLFLRGNPSLGK